MSDQRPNDAAMADILASIKRIVADEDKRFANSPLHLTGDVLELTPEMRVDQVDPAAARAASAPAVVAQAPPPPIPTPVAPPQPVRAGVEVPAPPLSIDEAHIAEIARAVVKAELSGAFGQTLTRNVKALIKDEVARALAARDAEKK